MNYMYLYMNACMYAYVYIFDSLYDNFKSIKNLRMRLIIHVFKKTKRKNIYIYVYIQSKKQQYKNY